MLYAKDHPPLHVHAKSPDCEVKIYLFEPEVGKEGKWRFKGNCKPNEVKRLRKWVGENYGKLQREASELVELWMKENDANPK